MSNRGRVSLRSHMLSSSSFAWARCSQAGGCKHATEAPHDPGTECSGRLTRQSSPTSLEAADAGALAARRRAGGRGIERARRRQQPVFRLPRQLYAGGDRRHACQGEHRVRPCHGVSDAHIADESWASGGNGTAPDIMYPRDKINPSCLPVTPRTRSTRRSTWRSWPTPKASRSAPIATGRIACPNAGASGNSAFVVTPSRRFLGSGKCQV